MSGGNDRIKSALEIAMEKAQKFGTLSDEERQRLKSDELVTAGNALAQRYLDGLPLRDVETELTKRTEEDRRIISSHMLSYLLQRIDIHYISQDDKILQAVEHWSDNPGVARKIIDLHREYTSALKRARKENLGPLESAKRDELKRRGIAGSAVEPVIESSPEWVRIQQELTLPFQKKLDELKRTV